MDSAKKLGSGRHETGFGVRVRTRQGLGLVVEKNGWHINPVNFFEVFKKIGEDRG